MTGFDDLTTRGQAQRLRQMAGDLLRREFGIEPVRVALVAQGLLDARRIDADTGAQSEELAR